VAHAKTVGQFKERSRIAVRGDAGQSGFEVQMRGSAGQFVVSARLFKWTVLVPFAEKMMLVKVQNL